MHTTVQILALIEKERSRQFTNEGFSIAHDSKWVNGELASAASVYAAPKDLFVTIGIIESITGLPLQTFDSAWPWDAEWLKKSDRVRDLVKAAALIIAEIERLERI